MQNIATHTPWYRRALWRMLDAAAHTTPLRALDARALADIGVHASEIGSIEAESRGHGVRVTRRRIVVAGC